MKSSSAVTQRLVHAGQAALPRLMIPHGRPPTPGLTSSGLGASSAEGVPLGIRAVERRGCFVLSNKFP